MKGFFILNPWIVRDKTQRDSYAQMVLVLNKTS